MFLLILDKNPIYSAELVPNGIVLKQVVELCQLICSAGISDVYKPIKQGKKLQEWIKKNPEWTYIYLNILMYRAKCLFKVSRDSFLKILQICIDLSNICNDSMEEEIETAIFRYSKDYKCNIPTNSELPIDECIEEYKKYITWKQKNKIRGY